MDPKPQPGNAYRRGPRQRAQAGAMHVVGARFERLGSAKAAVVEVRRRLPMPPGDVAVRPLGSTHYEQPASGFLFAGRFASTYVDAVVEIVRRHGGRLVSWRWERPPREQSGNCPGQATPARGSPDRR
jgi:hypothetical protein